MTVVLAAGRPAAGLHPSSTSRVGSSGRVIDWIRDAVEAEASGDIVVVAGYGLDEVTATYPDLPVIANGRWERTGAVGSLLCAPLSRHESVIACYGDVVFRADLVRALMDAPGPVVVAVDSAWEQRYEGRHEDLESAEKVTHRDGRLVDAGAHLSAADVTGEFTGVIRLTRATLEHLLARRGVAERWDLPALLRDFISSGIPVTTIEAREWAEIDAPGDLARFVLGSKAQTLARLRGLVHRSVVDRQCDFTRSEWQRDRAGTLARVSALFGESLVAVRSSASIEDGWEASQAGRFRSVLAVPAHDEARLAAAIDEVAASYPDDSGSHELLVQEFVAEPMLSGVVTTRVLGTGAPYRVVGFASGGTTDAATGAGSAELRTAFIRRATPLDRLSAAGLEELVPLLEAVDEIEALLGYDRLDIEFAQTADGRVHVFQVRPVVLPSDALVAEDADLEAAVVQAEARFQRLQAPARGVVGSRAIFGAMPDWNPAEIIGLRPSRLATSLYQHVITDETWARQRAEVGYRDVMGEPLLASFGGHPYVDTRLSFNSFVPASLPDGLAARLVDQYLARLAANPELHDKVEFQVALTCITPDFEERAARLLDGALTPSEIAILRDALVEVTRTAIVRSDGDVREAERLDRPSERVTGSLAEVRRLLQEARRGALPFAHLARQAFMATAILEAARAGGSLDEAIDAFLGSMSTVPSRMAEDGARVATGAITREAFIARYGHLRPGTYGLSAPRYDSDPARYLDLFIREAEPTVAAVSFAGAPARALQAALDRTGLGLDVAGFEAFARTAIEGREYAKFVFTRPLSDALEAIAEWGEALGYTREELMHCSLADLFAIERGDVALPLAEFVTNRVEEGRRAATISACIELPLLLTHTEDFAAFERQASAPNFVTGKRVVAPAVVVGGAVDPAIDGCILLLPNADPGYDWIFAHAIAGFITMFGGVNSHMAVRAHEFGIPAAIGVGETRYEALVRAPVIALDCGARRIQPLGHLS